MNVLPLLSLNTVSEFAIKPSPQNVLGPNSKNNEDILSSEDGFISLLKAKSTEQKQEDNPEKIQSGNKLSDLSSRSKELGTRGEEKTINEKNSPITDQENSQQDNPQKGDVSTKKSLRSDSLLMIGKDKQTSNTRQSNQNQKTNSSEFAISELSRSFSRGYSGNVEIYLTPILTSIMDISKYVSEIPPELREKISEIRLKLLNGKISLNEVYAVLADLRNLVKSLADSQNNLKKLESELSNLLQNLNSSSTGSSEAQINKIPSEQNPLRNQLHPNVIVNDFRTLISEKKETQRQGENNIFQPLLRTEVNIKANQQVLSSGQSSLVTPQNSFFVQFQTLSNIMDEVSGRIVINLKNNSNEMKMTLFPPELGKVFVKFENTAEGRLVGNIVVTTEKAFNLFQENLSVIKENLSNQGINVSDIKLSLDNLNLGNYGNFQQNDATTQEIPIVTFRIDKANKEYERISESYTFVKSHEGLINIYA
ncbi:MAG: flagellar hook-length control protein FliK [Brevinematia bacterium]